VHRGHRLTPGWNEGEGGHGHRFVRVVRSAGLVERARFAAWLGLAAALLLLGVPEISLAATADLQVTETDPIFVGITFIYRGAPEEANDLTVDMSMKRGLLTIAATDLGAPISAGERCSSSAPNSVTCSYQRPGTDFFYDPTVTDVRLDDGNDAVLFRPPDVGASRGLKTSTT
jgi:hypothetical protein